MTDTDLWAERRHVAELVASGSDSTTGHLALADWLLDALADLAAARAEVADRDRRLADVRAEVDAIRNASVLVRRRDPAQADALDAAAIRLDAALGAAEVATAPRGAGLLRGEGS